MESDTINKNSAIKEKTYYERKQELISHFINHTIWFFANEIKQSYPYDLSQADISQYKRCFTRSTKYTSVSSD